MQLARHAFTTFLLTAAWATASAIPLAPGEEISPTGTTAVLEPWRVGVNQADPLRPFQILDGMGNVVVEGNLQDRVNLSNDLGTLLFAPRLRDLSGPGSIVRLIVEGFGGFTTDVDFVLDGLGSVGPNEIARPALGDGDSLIATYDPNVITPPASGRFLTILTDATAFAPVGRVHILAVQENGIPIGVWLEQTYAPIPEPSALVLAAAGWIVLAGSRLRGRRRA